MFKAQDHVLNVALKTLNQGVTGGDRMKLLQEAAIMAQFQHPNVLRLYGIVHKDELVSHAYAILLHE